MEEMLLDNYYKKMDPTPVASHDSSIQAQFTSQQIEQLSHKPQPPIAGHSLDKSLEEELKVSARKPA